MKLINFVSCILISITGCVSSNRDCLAGLEQSSATETPPVLATAISNFSAMDFCLVGPVKRVEGTIDLHREPLVLDDTLCARFNSYNIFRMEIKKRKIYKDAYYPKFTITCYRFVDAISSALFFKHVLEPLEKSEDMVKAPYVYLLSGNCCLRIDAHAYMYYHDFMDKIITAIDEKGKRIDHLM